MIDGSISLNNFHQNKIIKNNSFTLLGFFLIHLPSRFSFPFMIMSLYGLYEISKYEEHNSENKNILDIEVSFLNLDNLVADVSLVFLLLKLCNFDFFDVLVFLVERKKLGLCSYEIFQTLAAG